MDPADLILQQLRWVADAVGMTPFAAAGALTTAALLALLPLIPATLRSIAPFPQQPSFRDACPFLHVLPDGHTIAFKPGRHMRA